MIFGHVCDNMPRLQLDLLSDELNTSIEVTVDTAFDGKLAPPLNVLDRSSCQFRLPTAASEAPECTV